MTKDFDCYKRDERVSSRSMSFESGKISFLSPLINGFKESMNVHCYRSFRSQHIVLIPLYSGKAAMTICFDGRQSSPEAGEIQAIKELTRQSMLSSATHGSRLLLGKRDGVVGT